ncbi:MAG: M48 family metallopeptidase [Bdellovibrionaceae bacterium]|nr:M48 family metallopeptidase [Pseudobdellovibrionaceae bacterium]
MSVENIHYLNRVFTVVRKSRRRTLSVKLSTRDSNKIYVSLGLTEKVILEFLMSKHDWLEKNLVKLEEIKSQEHHPEFKEGELFPFLGEMKYFTFVPYKNKKIKLQIEDGFISCYHPAGTPSDKEKIRQCLIQLYKRNASVYLIERCKVLSKEMKLAPNQIKIQTANTRWGSCNSHGTVNLNWKLMLFSPSLIDYVIIHELCHLKHLDHSENFWSLVKNFYPHYKQAQEYFKTEGLRISAFMN